MKNKISKSDAKKQIQEFFSNIKDKTPKEIKKIKRFAMSKNIPLKDLRKTFCKKCLTPYKDSKTRVKKGMKIVECGNCGFVIRWGINKLT